MPSNPTNLLATAAVSSARFSEENPANSIASYLEAMLATLVVTTDRAK